MEERIYKIYLLIFPNMDVYIGQTLQDLTARWDAGYGYKVGSRVGDAIRKYGWENVEKKLLHDNLTLEEADMWESIEIENYGGLNNPKVLNEQSGGRKGFKNSEYIKQRVAEGVNRFYDEHPEVLTQVDQYSYNFDTYLATYTSVAEASRITGVDPCHISACLTLNRISAGGYRWVYHGKRLGIIQYPKSGVKMPVMQIDKNTGEIINTFESVALAHRITGVAESQIARCIKGKFETAGGYKWKRPTSI